MSSGLRRQQAGGVYTDAQVGHALRTAGVRINSEIDSHYIVFCPYHDNRNTPAAEVDKESGLFYCFSCRASANLVELIEHQGFNYYEALRMIGDEDYDIAEQVDKILAEEAEPEPFDDAVLERLHSNVWTTGKEYFNGRNISDDSIVKFRLGYSDKRRMVIVPVHSPRGIPWGFVARSIQGKRFQNSTGLVRSHTLFNLHNVWTEPRIFVVESTFDTIRLDQVGIPSVATMGATISNTQIDLLIKTFDDIVVLPDNDGPEGAGSKMVRKVLKLIPYAQVVELEGVHDVGDMSDEDLTGLL